MKKRILWGILLMLLGVGLIFLTVFPEISLFDVVPVWKLLVGVLLLYWLLKRVLFGKRLADRLDVFFPLAIGVLVFEKEIGTALGLGEDFISTGAVIIIALLFTVATRLLFGGIGKKRTDKVSCNPADGDRPGPDTVYAQGCDAENRFGNMTVCFDLSVGNAFRVDSSFGKTTVLFQNVGDGTDTSPIELYIDNSFGKVNVYVPENWAVDCRMTSDFGEKKVTTDDTPKTRTLTVSGSTSFGAVFVTPSDT